MSPTQSEDEKGSEVCVRGEEDPLTQMLNDLTLTEADAKTATYKEPTIDLVEGLKHLDIKKEDDEKQNEESEEEEEETKEQIKLEEVNKHEEYNLNLNEEENEREINRSKEIDEFQTEVSFKKNEIQSVDDKTTEESDDENPPDDAYPHDKPHGPGDNYEPQNSYKTELESSPEEYSTIKTKLDEETSKKPKTKNPYLKRGPGAGAGFNYQNTFSDFMYQDQLRATAPYSAIQPNSSPAYAWSPDNAQNSSPPTHTWSPDNSFSMDLFDSSAYSSPPYMSGSDCGNLGNNGQIYINQSNNYQDQYSYPPTPPFSEGASIQDDSDFSDGAPSPMAPVPQDFAHDYAQCHDVHSLDDILEVLNKESNGGLDVTGCVPAEKIMPYLLELVSLPEGSENTDNTGNNQDVSPIHPRIQPRDIWPDGRNQTSAEHEIRKRLNPDVLEKTARQINYQENEKLCEKDEEGDTPYMVVVSNYDRKNYYELLYAMQERLKTIHMCCDLPVCVRTHACKVCGNADDLQFYSPLSMRNNVGDTALKNAVSMKFPKEVVNYLCSGLEERQGDMRRVFDMEATNFFQQNSFIYPVLARFL